MARILSLTLGVLTLLITIAVLCTQIVLSLHLDKASHGRSAAIVSAIFESVSLLFVGWQFISTLRNSSEEQFHRRRGVVCGFGLILCAISTASAIVSLAYSGKTDQDVHKHILVGASVVLTISCLSQIIFVLADFVLVGPESFESSWSRNKDEETARSHMISLKAIRYSRTLPRMSQTQGPTDMNSRGRSNSSGGKTAVESIRSSVTSVSQAIRHSSSKSKSPFKDKSRTPSIDSFTNRSSSGDDTFDSWDTSTVDLHNRQVVLEMASPTSAKFHSLETIPASPLGSRSPSPDFLAPFGPPRMQNRPRSRSYSPVSLQRELLDLPTPTTPGSNSEAHIHPLFRSDSPDPPPLATPGTSVIAAPDAARVVVHKSSNRSLSRLRSGSLPVSPSPLSKQGSFDDFRSMSFQTTDLRPAIEAFEVEEPGSLVAAERKMTPPVPEWLLKGQ